VGDYHVDRPEVDSEQSLELTGTNRPDTYQVRYKTNAIVWPWKFFSVQLSPATSLEFRLGVAVRIKFLAVMAAGFHPFPSRTRQLSPPAPMVVGPQGPSRVGRRQIIRPKSPPIARSSGLFAFQCRVEG
jgi:hypothetical protein